MKLLFYVFPVFFLFIPGLHSAQHETVYSKLTTKDLDAKIQEYKLLAHSDPTEGTKKLMETKNYCAKIGHKDGAMKSSMGLVLIYYNDGDYKKSIEETRTVEKYAKELQHNEYLSDIYRMRSNVYGEMGLLKESLAELKKALPYADKIDKPNQRFYKKALINESYAGKYDKKGEINKQLYYRKKSIEETMKMEESIPVIKNAKYQNLAYQYASLGNVYSSIKEKDSAGFYFEKALGVTEDKKYDIYPNARATLYSDMAKFYAGNENYPKAILFAKRAERLEKGASMPYIRKDIYHSLFNSYVETDKKDSSKYYLNLYTSLNDSLMKSERENIIAPVNQVISDKEKENTGTVRNVLLLSLLLLILVVLIGLVYWRRKNSMVHKKYESLIAKIREENAQKAERKELQKLSNGNGSKSLVSITDETSKSILQKLEKFEMSDKFVRKDISLPYLAGQLNTNTTYLSEIIKIHREKSFNEYINGLRISYITHKLVEDPRYREYKISYLAEQCGFASSQVFVIHFKKITGFTPSYFIENLKKEKNI